MPRTPHLGQPEGARVAEEVVDRLEPCLLAEHPSLGVLPAGVEPLFQLDHVDAPVLAANLLECALHDGPYLEVP